MAHAVAAAADLLDADDELVVGIVTGAGGTFCAWMDLKASCGARYPGSGAGGGACVGSISQKQSDL